MIIIILFLKVFSFVVKMLVLLKTRIIFSYYYYYYYGEISIVTATNLIAMEIEMRSE